LVHVHIIGERGGDGALCDVAYIRLYIPFQLLALGNHIDLTIGNTYAGYENSDVFIVHRTWYATADINAVEQLIKMVYLMKKKLIYDIDDYLYDVPTISFLNKAAMWGFARHADMVVVSTPALGKRMRRFNNNIQVIPNFLDSGLFKERRGVFIENNPIVIGYMGTLTHQRDFQMIKLPLMRVLKKYQPNVRCEIIGAITNKDTLRSIPSIKIIDRSEMTDYFSYWRWMCKNCFWDIGIAPLKYDDFTCCKSDIKYLDYSALGIAGIYSNHPAYKDSIKHRETGLLVENNCDAWQEALEEMILNASLRNTIRLNAQNELWENRLMQDNVIQWLKILNTLLQEKDILGGV